MLKSKNELRSTVFANAGFSLLELIVAMALVSLISVILFDSLVTQWSNMQRVSAAYDRISQANLKRSILEDIVGELVPAWPEERDAVFSGNTSGFHGLTNRPFDTGPSRLQAFNLSLEREGGAFALVLSGGDLNSRILEDIQDSSFFYQAMNGEWLDHWPPQANPGNGFFDDGTKYDTPQLPEAIRLDFTHHRKAQAWIMPLENKHGLPFRLEEQADTGLIP